MENRASIAQLSDEELAVQAAAGSHTHFDELACRFAPRLFAFLRSRLSSHQETEDLVQETMLKVLRNLNRYHPEWKFSTWIYTIASRLAISHYRSLRSRSTNLPLPIPSSQDPQDIVIRNQSTRNLWDQASSLPPEQYRALWLFYGEGMPVKEVSLIMKKHPVTVRVLLHRARSGLYELISAAPWREVKAPITGAQNSEASNQA